MNEIFVGSLPWECLLIVWQNASSRCTQTDTLKGACELFWQNAHHKNRLRDHKDHGICTISICKEKLWIAYKNASLQGSLMDHNAQNKYVGRIYELFDKIPHQMQSSDHKLSTRTNVKKAMWMVWLNTSS